MTIPLILINFQRHKAFYVNHFMSINDYIDWNSNVTMDYNQLIKINIVENILNSYLHALLELRT